MHAMFIKVIISKKTKNIFEGQMKFFFLNYVLSLKNTQLLVGSNRFQAKSKNGNGSTILAKIEEMQPNTTMYYYATTYTT